MHIAFVYADYKMVCKPLFDRGMLGTLPCVVYSLNSFNDSALSYSIDEKKIVIVDQELNMYYPLDYITQTYCEYEFDNPCPNASYASIRSKEFSINKEKITNKIKEKKDSEDLSFSNSFTPADLNILSAFQNHSSSLSMRFTVNNTEQIICTSPFNISLPLLQEYSSYMSVGLSVSLATISKKFDKLSDNIAITIMAQVIVYSIILVVMIMVVCVISYKISSSVLAPIDDLVSILKRLHKDLGVDVLSHLKKGPPEIIDLYEVFDRLRLILRFEDAQLFKDPTYAMMNYAQALKLFHSFNNKRAMEICFQEIAHIHMNYERFMEAAINYHFSYQLAEELKLSESEMAEAMIRANVKIQRAKEMFYEALVFYDTQDIYIRISSYLELIECLLMIFEGVEPEMKIVGQLITRITENEEGFVLYQKLLYLKGLQSYQLKHFRTAAEYCTESLESFPIVDRVSRTKSLALLKKIFKKFKIPADQVSLLEKALAPSSIDAVLAVDCKIGGALNEDVLIEFIENIITPTDRLSFIQFDEECQILFNLTKLPRRRCSTNTSLFDSRNICVLNDAILAALRQLISIKSLTPQSFICTENTRKE